MEKGLYSSAYEHDACCLLYTSDAADDLRNV